MNLLCHEKKKEKKNGVLDMLIYVGLMSLFLMKN